MIEFLIFCGVILLIFCIGMIIEHYYDDIAYWFYIGLYIKQRERKEHETRKVREYNRGKNYYGAMYRPVFRNKKRLKRR